MKVNFTKKLGIIFLCIVVLLSTIPLTTQAASSKITATGLSYPSKTHTYGKKYIVRGTIKSGIKITKITGTIKNAKGKTVYSKTVKPNKYSYKLAGSAIDDAMHFTKLAVGKYTFTVTAWNKSTSKKVINSTFTVKMSNSSKAKVAYKNFLAKNVSKFVADEYDFYTENKESYKKTSSFLLVDMDKNGIPELVTLHPDSYKSDTLYVYTYKNNTVSKIGSIDITCSADGWYTVYSCKEGHLHTYWRSDFTEGKQDTAYRVKSGKLSKYTGDKKKCTNKKYLQNNNASNRGKIK